MLPHPKMLPRRRELSQRDAPWFHRLLAAAKPSRVTDDARSDVPVSAVADPSRQPSASRTRGSSPPALPKLRAHQKVENTSPHSRDVTLGEDRSRIRTDPSVFARLRSFASNILKANRTDTLPQDHYHADLAGLMGRLKMPTVP